METLEIELSYIQHLIDDEVIQAVHQYYNWEILEDCASLYALDVSYIDDPAKSISGIIYRKADEYLSAPQAEKFKAAWQKLERDDQLQLAVRVYENT